MESNVGEDLETANAGLKCSTTACTARADRHKLVYIPIGQPPQANSRKTPFDLK